MPSTAPADDDPETPMVLARPRRANAGSHMSKLLALAEAEDAEQAAAYGEIFAEAPDDIEFTAEGADDGDVSLSSSSSEDENAGEEDEGERALRREERGAAGKRKRESLLQQAMKRARAKTAAKAAKAVRLAEDASSAGDTAAVGTAGTAERPRKRSERVSWLPTADDGPTRASSRKLAQMNRAATHERLKEKEQHRLRTVAIMKAAEQRKEGTKAKVLTQADRLAAAAATERQNAKSLNKWEETERRRVEEQRARLAALKNRKLEGPVITYWSGQAVWRGDTLVWVGKPREEKKTAAKGPGILCDNNSAPPTREGSPAVTLQDQASKKPDEELQGEKNEQPSSTTPVHSESNTIDKEPSNNTIKVAKPNATTPSNDTKDANSQATTQSTSDEATIVVQPLKRPASPPAPRSTLPSQPPVTQPSAPPNQTSAPPNQTSAPLPQPSAPLPTKPSAPPSQPSAPPSQPSIPTSTQISSPPTQPAPKPQTLGEILTAQAKSNPSADDHDHPMLDAPSPTKPESSAEEGPFLAGIMQWANTPAGQQSSGAVPASASASVSVPASVLVSASAPASAPVPGSNWTSIPASPSAPWLPSGPPPVLPGWPADLEPRHQFQVSTRVTPEERTRLEALWQAQHPPAHPPLLARVRAHHCALRPRQAGRAEENALRCHWRSGAICRSPHRARV
ncbi:YL1-domain-containing protein [Trichodelitschia bisporula]|uniref:YL1-domain-containing protein n=1 Tax=Trichodelitschia bisporula TaxID=703511 RepID=A0A6G1HX86_9PEZI|nr:YL1-domain-containing protein [Trichodelitschia bisporula]